MGSDRVTLTILFTDVVGSTALSAERGDSQTEEILERSARIVRDAVVEHGGREVKSLGDGLLCSFRSSGAAVAAAGAAQRGHAAWSAAEPGDAVAIRIGIHTGEVTETASDVRGAAVNAAARICAHAGGGEILVSATTQGTAGAGAALRLSGNQPVELQGFPEAFEVATAEWREPEITAIAEQRIRFAEIEGHRLAWSEVGRGPALVVPAPWVSNVHSDWESPGYRRFIERLAAAHTVIRYDRPGTGLSDRHLPDRLSLDHDVAVLEALLTDLEVGPVSLLGISSGGCVAAGFAARNPAQTTAVVFYGCYRDGSMLAPAAVRDSIVSVIRANWGLGARMLADIFVPGGTAEEREEWADFQRNSADPEIAADLYELVYSYDASRALEHVTAPSLVLHRRDDVAVPFGLGRELASRLPNSRLVPLEGRNHLPWQGDSEAVTREALSFLAAHPPAATPSPGDSGGTAIVSPATSRRSTGLGGPIDPPELSPRELEVLKLVGDGRSDREIAEELVLSPHTVHRHVANIRTKLAQPSRAAAVAHAARIGLI